MSTIQVYTTAFCPFCEAAKKLLTERNIPFETVDVSDPEEKAALKEKTGWRTVSSNFYQRENSSGVIRNWLNWTARGNLKNTAQCKF